MAQFWSAAAETNPPPFFAGKRGDDDAGTGRGQRVAGGSSGCARAGRVFIRASARLCTLGRASAALGQGPITI